MSLESFYHEVALRQASADRDNLKPLPPRWRRLLATLPPAAKRSIATIAVAALAIALWWLHPPINRYLLNSSPHPHGAADVLAAVAHHAHPIERAHRLVLACARENDAHACMEAIRQALTVVQPQDAAMWLKEQEVHALRVNAYFAQFANDLENHPDRLNQQIIISTAAAVRFPQTKKPEPHTAQTKSVNANLPGGLMERTDSFKPTPIAPRRSTGFLLGAGASMKTNSSLSPEASLDTSAARPANSRDRINQSPIKPAKEGSSLGRVVGRPD